MSAMIERVARAIATENGDDYDKIPDSKSEWNKEHGEFDGRFRDVNEPSKADYLAMAKAALVALIPPTQAMISAGYDVGYSPDPLPCDHVFMAMIDEALK